VKLLFDVKPYYKKTCFIFVQMMKNSLDTYIEVNYLWIAVKADMDNLCLLMC